MSFEVLVGLQVLDDPGYDAYRAAMKPILANYHGQFRNDFKVSETRLSTGSELINRVFTISFPDQNHMDGFFSDPNYLAVRAEFFEPAVGGAYRLAMYENLL